MPFDQAPAAARHGEPGDLCHPVADRDQKHPAVAAATQANARNLAKRHVNHAAYPQPLLVRLAISRHESSHTVYSGAMSPPFARSSSSRGTVNVTSSALIWPFCTVA